MFTPEQLEDIAEFIEVHEQAKILDEKKKRLSQKVKSYMTNEGTSSFSYNGANLNLTNSTRWTVSKATKDEFIAKLNAMGKSNLIKIDIDVNKESLETEIATGGISQSFVDQYIKITDILTLRCS